VNQGRTAIGGELRDPAPGISCAHGQSGPALRDPRTQWRRADRLLPRALRLANAAGQLPGWPQYGHFHAEHGIAGAVGTAQILQGEPRVVVYVEVDDPQAYLDRAEQLGGQPILPVTEIPQAQITVAWMRVPQGNIIGLVKPD
jgi:predicted enzyme related to lactoylglutathione lyase